MAKCRYHKTKFKPKYPFQKYCLEDAECIASHVEYAKEQQRKSWRKEKKKLKDGLKTRSDYLSELQVIFNTYIRLRDKDESCISCSTQKDVKYDAGHFYSVGAYPNIRFNEDNCHKQCSNNCNVHLSGNVHEYRPRLIEKIGIARFNHLNKVKNEPLRITIEKIQEKKTYYRKLIKELK
jgi:hypothetical protein